MIHEIPIEDIRCLADASEMRTKREPDKHYVRLFSSIWPPYAGEQDRDFLRAFCDTLWLMQADEMASAIISALQEMREKNTDFKLVHKIENGHVAYYFELQDQSDAVFVRLIL